MQPSSGNEISHSSLSDTFASPDLPREGASEAANALAGLKKSIRQLKAIMLSLEWDMSMETLSQLDKEIAAQQTRWKGDKSITGLLRILGALGKYIGRIQAQTHPLAIKLFFAVYNGLEKIVLSPDMSEAKKKKIVLLAYQRYNEVKQKLALREKLLIQKQQESALSSESEGQIIAPVEAEAEVDIATGGEQEAVETESADVAVDGQPVIPALGDADFSAEDEEKRKVWLEDGESGDLSTKLSSFFGNDWDEASPSTGTAVEEEIVALAGEENDQQTDEAISEEPAAQEEAAVAGVREEKKGVIDELFSPTEDSPADELLTDMHLSVFSSNDPPPTTPPVSLQNPQQVDSDGGDKSPLDNQITEKLDAFFDEPASEEKVVLEKDEEKAEEADQEPSGAVSEEEFSGHLQKKLDSFFDEEEQGEGQDDADVVPLQPAASPTGAKPFRILQELLKEIRQQSDDYKHLPDAEERGVLANLFARVEKACQDMPEVIIPLSLLSASLFSFEGSKEQTCTTALECAAELAGVIQPLSEGQADDGKDFGKLIMPLKKFLSLIETAPSLPQGTADSNTSASGYPDYRVKRDLSRKKSKPESSYKANGDLIIEDLFSDE